MSQLLILVVALASATAAAQHQSHKREAASSHGRSPYAGEQSRAIKALSDQERRGWLEGQGAGLARAAELNGYPGPMHVLELAAGLRLTDVQRRQSQDLMDRHKAEVRHLGAELVEAERQIDELFRAGAASPQSVTARVEHAAMLQARIRTSHLLTHIEQTNLLSPAQITEYNRLRGYAR